ncbi:uncharacterized protein [Henckelia pumila]|uniref:uncharacterized protein n=1 Tax=Henckelia pumila TaxID=405737 RepID=UPI003C6E1CD6
MEFLDIYTSFFININLQSIKLFLKNGKSMASIAISTNSLLSILIFLFSFSIKSLNSNMLNYFLMESSTPTNTTTSSSSTFFPRIFLYIALLFLVEFAFIFAFVAISHISSIATILISAASYTDKNITFQDLLSMIAKKWKRPWITGFRGSRTQPARYSVLVVFLAAALWVTYPNTLTFCISILLGTAAAIFVMYSSVAWVLAVVASVVEEGCLGKEALEKGEELAKGHRVHGFLLNVFFNLVMLIPFLVYWLVYGDKVYLALPYLGLVMVNMFSLVKMLVTVEYTLLYFESKKYHGQEIEAFGDLQYTKVPSDDGTAQV